MNALRVGGGGGGVYRYIDADAAVLELQVASDYGSVMLNTYRVVVGDGGTVSTGIMLAAEGCAVVYTVSLWGMVALRVLTDALAVLVIGMLPGWV